MNVTYSIVDEGLISAVDVVNRFVKISNGIVGPIKRFAPFKLDIERFAAGGTSHGRIILKPSKRLLELVVAVTTGNRNLLVI